MHRVSVMEPWERAIEVIRVRARQDRLLAEERLDRVLGVTLAGRFVDAAPQLPNVGRLTLNFHPDRIAADGNSVAAGLAEHGRYRNQWVTWISSGGRSALAGGDRHRWERDLFDHSYEGLDPTGHEFPIYGAFDLLGDPFGGSPRFGSCFVVLSEDVFDRATMCVGDSHLDPRDVGTGNEVASILAGLAEQAVQGELLGRQLGVEELIAVLDGHQVVHEPGRELDWYIETQIHGGVDLSTDVDTIVADPSFQGTHVEGDLGRAAERFGFELDWHQGSELAVTDTPGDFRGPTMPALARYVADDRGVVDAAAIGRAAASITPHPPLPEGDPDESDTQQLKYLWHTVLAHGTNTPQHP
ncbi:MAG: DUF3626 domain-containing protein [Sulfitobacter sp.]|nr:DUF3626 domain-containing protein [Sulfitobacter sp.]